MSATCISARARYNGVNYWGSVYTGLVVGLCFGLALPIACFLVFAYYKNSSILLRRRSSVLVLISILGSLIILAHTFVYDVVGPADFPCWLYYTLLYTNIPLIATPLLLRLKLYSNAVSAARKRNFASKAPLHQSRVVEGRSTAPSQDGSSVSDAGASVGERSGKTPASAAMAPFNLMLAYLRVQLCGRRAWARPQKQSFNDLERLAQSFAQSDGFIWLWLFIALLPCLLALTVRLAITPAVQEGCNGCDIALGDVIFFMADVSILLVVGLWIAIPLYFSGRDPLRLLDEFILAWIGGSQPALVGLVLQMLDPGQLYVNRQMDWMVLCWVAGFCMVMAQTLFVVYLAKRSKWDSIANPEFAAEERLNAVLHDATMKSAFRAHLIDELGDESLAFLDAADNFVAKFEQEGKQRRARMIFDEFVARGAPLEINISSGTREHLALVFQRGNVSMTVFEVARQEVVRMMCSDTFPRFLKKYEDERAQTRSLAAAGEAVDVEEVG
jgi:hypothetical protein